MALIKPEQLQSGSYSITGSFSGSFYGDGSNLNNLPVPSIDTGSLVTTSSFNSFTSSYYADSGSFSTRVTNLENFSSSLDATFATEAELNAATSSLSASISYLSSSFETFSGSYNTGSFSGSFIGDLTGTASYAQTASYISASNIDGTVTSASYALTASYLDNYIPPFPYTGSAEITGSLSVTGSTSLFNSGSTILSVNGAQGEIFNITDDTSGDLLIVQSGSTDLFVVSASGDTTISGSLTINGPQGEIFSITDDLTGDLFTIQSGSVDLFVVSASGDTTISGSLIATNGITSSLYGTSSWAENSLTASYVENAQTASYIENAQTASYVLQAVSASHALTASYVNTLNQDVLITGSLTVLQGATIYGSSSFTYLTASQLAVSASFISVNVFEPVQRFGGLIVYDSGSSLATASLAWDSLHNHWVYQNASGSTYTGGMLLSGPRNTGSLGNEPTLTQWFIPRSDGTDHLDDSQIYSSGSTHIITGSLTVTGDITGSLSGSATTSTSASFASTASFVNPLVQNVLITGSLNITGSFNTNNLLYTSGSNIGVGNVSANPAYNTYFSGSTNVSNSIDIGPFGSGGHNLSVRGYTSVGSISTGGYGAIGSNYYLDNAGVLRTRYNDRVSALEFSSGGFLFRTAAAAAPNTSVGLTNLMYLDRLGTLGLGTTPTTLTSALLHISGANSAALLRLDAPGSSSILHVTGSGRVGIGTAAPNARLDVSGSAIITGSLTVTEGITGSISGSATNAVSSSFASTSSYSNLTINSTPIAGGTSGNVLFQNAGLLLSSTNLVFNTTLGYLSVGQGTSPGARLDVRAQGSGSSNLVFRIRNNANTNDILSLYGNSTLFYTGSSIITGSLTVTGSLTNQPVTLTATSGTASINCTQGNFFDLTLSSSSTIHLSSSNIQPGQTINLRITQPATSGSLTYGSQFKFPGGIPYSASATGSVVDIVSFISFDSTTLYGSAIKNLS